MATTALKILTSADLLGCKEIQWVWQHSIYISTKAHNKKNLMNTGHHELCRTLKDPSHEHSLTHLFSIYLIST